MIRFILNIYIFVLFVDFVLSFMPQYKNHDYVKTIRKVSDYTLIPVRKILPKDLPFDFSPLVVVILIRLIIVLF